AEDGIRDRNVTGVQTCALPILFQNPELQFITHKVFDEVFINMESRFEYSEAVRQTEVILQQMGLNNTAHLHPLEISTGQKRRLKIGRASCRERAQTLESQVDIE